MRRLRNSLDLDLVTRLEAHSVVSWPPTVVEPWGDGWLLRATPGLDRGRSNHALTPCRPLVDGELAAAVARARGFAGAHGVALGVQVSPMELHGGVLEALLGDGWSAAMSVRVLSASVAAVTGDGPALELLTTDSASPEWLSAWAACEGRSRASVAAHARTVFAGLRGRASFARSADGLAVGVSVQSDGLVGLFCLAVAPEARRAGLGGGLVRGLLSAERCDASTAYLQVEGSNASALALYDRLGFGLAYRYVHCVAP